MAKLSDRENSRTVKKTPVENIISEPIEVETKKQVNKEEEKYVHRTYYVTEELIRAIAFESADTGKDKSQIVRDALEKHLKDRL